MLSCTNYSRFDPFYDALIQTVEAIRLLSPIEVSRIGLRYINQITVEEASPLDWARYICSDLLAGIRFAPNKSALSRAMGLLEFNFGDSFMRLQYGMPNPDFPAAIRQKLFVLDYDHYTTGVMSLSDATNHVEVFNKMIYAHFDASITDELKALMRIAVES